MKIQNRRFSFVQVLVASSALLAGALGVVAQDSPPPGGFDPAQMRQRRLEQIRQAFGVTDDAEWQVISEKLSQVMELRRAGRPPLGGPGGFGGPGRPQRPPAAEAPGNESTPAEEAPQPPAGPPPPRGELSPEVQAVQKAIEAKAPTSELKARLAELKAARAKQQVELGKAQDDLRQVLSTQQEAIAVLYGLL